MKISVIYEYEDVSEEHTLKIGKSSCKVTLSGNTIFVSTAGENLTITKNESLFKVVVKCDKILAVINFKNQDIKIYDELERKGEKREFNEQSKNRGPIKYIYDLIKDHI